MRAAKAELVESFIAPADMVVDGEQITKDSWVIGVRITDDALWNRIEKNELNAFSLDGTGVRISNSPY